MSSPQAVLGAQVRTPMDSGEHEQPPIFSHFSLKSGHLINMAMDTFISFSLYSLTLLCILFAIARVAIPLSHGQQRQRERDRTEALSEGCLI